MMQKLCAFTERVTASAARVVRAAFAPFGTAPQGMTSNDTTTLAWFVMPSVHATAICTNGKRYERRLQEMLT